jgi:hypothetical protein
MHSLREGAGHCAQHFPERELIPASQQPLGWQGRVCLPDRGLPIAVRPRGSLGYTLSCSLADGKPSSEHKRDEKGSTWEGWDSD